MSLLADRVLDAIRQVVGPGPVMLHEPQFRGHEWRYVKECLDTGWVSSVGSYVDRFERDLAAYTGAAHAIVVSNGTVGLETALRACGVGAGDEVIVPALSFVATANAVVHCGAHPHFVDSEMGTLGLDPSALDGHLRDVARTQDGACFNRRTGRRIAAVVPMHTFGHPVDMPALDEVAQRHRLTIVEDAAESLGSLLGGRHTGTFGRCGVFSFNGNKIITTGGGGAIVTDDAELARRIKHLTTTAKLPHRWAYFHDEVGYNYRMPNLNAALGCAQLENLETLVASKRALTERYARALAGIDGVSLHLERPGTRANYWLQTLLLAPGAEAERDPILQATNDAGVMTRPAWDLLSTLPMYRDSPRAPLPVATDLARRLVNLPSSPKLALEAA